MFNESTLWDDCNYIGTKVSRFLEGPEVPLGIFPHIRPTTPSSVVTTTAATATNATTAAAANATTAAATTAGATTTTASATTTTTGMSVYSDTLENRQKQSTSDADRPSGKSVNR